jgi:hypothetical protein
MQLPDATGAAFAEASRPSALIGATQRLGLALAPEVDAWVAMLAGLVRQSNDPRRCKMP